MNLFVVIATGLCFLVMTGMHIWGVRQVRRDRISRDALMTNGLFYLFVTLCFAHNLIMYLMLPIPQ